MLVVNSVNVAKTFLPKFKKLILSNSVLVVFIKKFSKPCYNETNINLEHVCLIYPNTAKRYFVKMKKPF